MVDSEIQPPIFIADGNDLSVLPTVESAEQHVESPDVDEYELFDSTGRKLRFLGKTEPAGRWITSVAIEPVHLVAAEETPSHQEELRTLILRCLAAVGETSSQLKSRPLDELIREATRRFSVP
jgi:hypothetical protein